MAAKDGSIAGGNIYVVLGDGKRSANVMGVKYDPFSIYSAPHDSRIVAFCANNPLRKITALEAKAFREAAKWVDGHPEVKALCVVGGWWDVHLALSPLRETEYGAAILAAEKASGDEARRKKASKADTVAIMRMLAGYNAEKSPHWLKLIEADFDTLTKIAREHVGKAGLTIPPNADRLMLFKMMLEAGAAMTRSRAVVGMQKPEPKTEVVVVDVDGGENDDGDDEDGVSAGEAAPVVGGMDEAVGDVGEASAVIPQEITKSVDDPPPALADIKMVDAVKPDPIVGTVVKHIESGVMGVMEAAMEKGEGPYILKLLRKDGGVSGTAPKKRVKATDVLVVSPSHGEWIINGRPESPVMAQAVENDTGGGQGVNEA